MSSSDVSVNTVVLSENVTRSSSLQCTTLNTLNEHTADIIACSSPKPALSPLMLYLNLKSSEFYACRLAFVVISVIFFPFFFFPLPGCGDEVVGVAAIVAVEDSPFRPNASS